MNNVAGGIHTTTGPNETGWVNTVNGRVVSRRKTKATAIATGRQLAKRHAEQFTIHRKDGTVIVTGGRSRTPGYRLARVAGAMADGIEP